MASLFSFCPPISLVIMHKLAVKNRSFFYLRSYLHAHADVIIYRCKLTDQTGQSPTARRIKEKNEQGFKQHSNQFKRVFPGPSFYDEGARARRSEALGVCPHIFIHGKRRLVLRLEGVYGGGLRSIGKDR